MKRNDRDLALAIYIYYRLSKSWCDMFGISIDELYEYLVDFKELIKEIKENVRTIKRVRTRNKRNVRSIRQFRSKSKKIIRTIR